MAVAEGRNGKITWVTGASSQVTIAELGEWSYSGISRNMIDYTAFGDTVSKFKPGMQDPGTITFRGHYDGEDTNGQVEMITSMTSGTPIYCSSSDGYPCKLRLWANDDTSFDSYGFWMMSTTAGSDGRIYINSMETDQNKDGLATISFTLKVSGAMLDWTTTT